jgi:DegV family protein with EDD domain
VPTLEHLVRGGRVPPMKGFIAKLFGLLPVLTLTKKGTAEAVARARGFEPALRRMMDLLFRAADVNGGGASAAPSRDRRFGVAHCDAPELADRLSREIRGRYPESDVMIVECGPALGAHGGPGAVAVAVLA